MTLTTAEYKLLQKYREANGKVQEDISTIDKERLKYNKEHNVLLSYGQYVSMLYLNAKRKSG